MNLSVFLTLLYLKVKIKIWIKEIIIKVKIALDYILAYINAKKKKR